MMRDWRNRVQTLIDRHESLTSRRVSFGAAQTEFTEAARRLPPLRRASGYPAWMGDPLAAARAHPRRDCCAAKGVHRGAYARSQPCQCQSRIAEAEKEIAAIDEKSEALAPDWSDALAILALGPDAGAAEAEAALALWTTAIADLRQFGRMSTGSRPFVRISIHSRPRTAGFARGSVPRLRANPHGAS